MFIMYMYCISIGVIISVHMIIMIIKCFGKNSK